MPRGQRRAAGRRLILPSWISSDQPLYLNPTICRRIRRDFDPAGIFLNIPYSRRYTNLEVAIISTVTAYGLLPRMARERLRMEMRLLKIAELVLTCNYGFTDLSYLTRMNMPLELGLLLAFGKETLVVSRRRYSALKTISDLNFADIHYHEGRIRKLVVTLSRWIEQTCSRKRLKTETLLRRYRQLRRVRRSLGDDFDRLKAGEISKLLGVAEDEFQMRLAGA
ncbi:MAG: hypothetical protein L0191_11045 [Acidobacteria bacterium]|nr:hypothetical protein [Acidobacteriota bacterium]